jgi:hypothetical protein
MRVIRFLLRHRVMRWWREPTWGVGTVLRRLVRLGLLLSLFYLLGLGSLNLGALIREVRPDGDVHRIINSGMLALVPVLTAGRFFLQSPSSMQMTPYLDLPVDRTSLLRGRILMFLLSGHTGAAVVLVVPVWTAEVWTVLPGMDAGAWLGAALLVAAVLPSLGAQLLNVLLGRFPKWFVVVLAGGIALAGADALLALDLFRGLSRGMFGMPIVGLSGTLAVTGGMYWGVLRAMEARLETDRRTTLQEPRPSARDGNLYRWVEQALPVGRLVALELRQIARTRRLRGLALLGLVVAVGWYGATLAEVFIEIEPSLAFVGLTGLGPTFGVGFIVFGISAGRTEGMLARPHSPRSIVWAKLILLWLGMIPGTLLLPVFLPWLSPAQSSLLLGFALWWSGIVVPALVYVAPRLRKPVDTGASAFAISVHTLHGIGAYPLVFVPMIAVPIAATSGRWWGTGAVLGGIGLVGLLTLPWTITLLVRQFASHRHGMMAGFRENEPV